LEDFLAATRLEPSGERLAGIRTNGDGRAVINGMVVAGNGRLSFLNAALRGEINREAA